MKKIGFKHMKKVTAILMALLAAMTMTLLSGCGSAQEDPGPPPLEVVNPGSTDHEEPESNTDSDSSGTSDGEVLENAVSVRIGREGRTEWAIHMYNNAAANTMLNYLSGSALLFPTYTYEKEEGYVAQRIRGSYTRDDEIQVMDVHTGELYLFSDGQLRFYFKDVERAEITATPAGRFAQTEGLTDAVQSAYESNLGDTWGVDVYFWITKILQE